MTRLCSKCGKPHGMVLENRIIGETEDIDVCHGCLFDGCKINIITEQITLEECENLDIHQMKDLMLKKENEIKASMPAHPLGE